MKKNRVNLSMKLLLLFLKEWNKSAINQYPIFYSFYKVFFLYGVLYIFISVHFRYNFFLFSANFAQVFLFISLDSFYFNLSCHFLTSNIIAGFFSGDFPGDFPSRLLY